LLRLNRFPMITKYSFIKNLLFKNDVYYITENNDWIITQIGKQIRKSLNRIGIKSSVTVTQKGIYNSVIHYGSINTFYPECNRLIMPHKSNKTIVTYFHVVPGDKRLADIKKIDGFVDIWHTACNKTKNDLIKIGIPQEKIRVVPVGIDLGFFKPVSQEEKNTLRLKLGIPQGSIVIGSFQKDGIGWDEGLEPKLIKGPDLFCEAVKTLAKKYPVYVLLTGPARGYVKNKLEDSKIPYRHSFVRRSELPKLYGILDLYLITSKIEGVPMSVLECMATQTPFVTTRVGLAPDIIRDLDNGLLCDIDDIDEVVRKSQLLIEDNNLREKIAFNMGRDILKFSWENIIREYKEKLYSELIAC